MMSTISIGESVAAVGASVGTGVGGSVADSATASSGDVESSAAACSTMAAMRAPDAAASATALAAPSAMSLFDAPSSYAASRTGMPARPSVTVTDGYALQQPPSADVSSKRYRVRRKDIAPGTVASSAAFTAASSAAP